jgi:hypothetical protein
MSDRDYYEIMGLTPGADGPMVDQAYWHLARKYQLLAATNERAGYLLDELNEAYGVLGTPRLREQYDAFRDDVLIRAGMIKPVKAKKDPAPRKKAAPAQEPHQRTLPSLHIKHGTRYATSAIIAALAFAAAWQGVNPVFVLGALALGLGLSLMPLVQRRLADMSVDVPALPSMPAMQSMPDVKAPQFELPKLAEFNVGKLRELSLGAAESEEATDPEELATSTAAMISRWRNSVGLKNIQPDMLPGADVPIAPSGTLVEIVESERELDSESEPIAAVLDILRGTRNSIERS